MKVLAINGSPRPDGNTAYAIGLVLGQLEQQVEKFCAYQCPQNPKEKGLLCPAGVFSPGFELPVEVQPRGSGAQQGQQAVRGEESAAKIPIG